MSEGADQRIQVASAQARKRASAMIAKIPLSLSRHIARVYYPMLFAVAWLAAFLSTQS